MNELEIRKIIGETHYDHLESDELLRNASLMEVYPKVYAGRFLIMSERELHKDCYAPTRGEIPRTDGDYGMYFTSEGGVALGMASFNVLRDMFSIESIKPLRPERKYVERIHRVGRNNLSWAHVLIEAIEETALKCDYRRIRLRPSFMTRGVIEEEITHNEAMIFQDFPATSCGYEQLQQAWYEKELKIRVPIK